MVLYGIPFFSLTEELRDTDPTLLSSFYVNGAVFDGLVRRSAEQLRLLIEQGLDRGYFSDLSKSLFMADKPEEKEVARLKFERAGLNLNYVNGSLYLGTYLGTRGGQEDWVCPKVEAWSHGVRTLAKIAYQCS